MPGTVLRVKDPRADRILVSRMGSSGWPLLSFRSFKKKRSKIGLNTDTVKLKSISPCVGILRERDDTFKEGIGRDLNERTI